MSERTLPFALDVPCIAYHNLAFPLGIMKANISNFDEWLCNKLIDCKYENNYGRYNLFDSDIWEYAKGVTQTQSFHITPDLFNCNAFDIIGIIRYMIDHGNYIMGLLNEKYLPMKKAYGEYDFVHDFLIYGYLYVKTFACKTFVCKWVFFYRRYIPLTFSGSSHDRRLNDL